MSSGSAEESRELTLEERVRGHLLRDLALADVLSRGLANIGRTARSLERPEWDEGVTDILDALDGYRDEERPPPFRQARRSLEETTVGLETGLALLTVERSISVRERLEDAWPRFTKVRRTSIIDHGGMLQLVLNAEIIRDLKAILPEGSIIEEQGPASTVKLKVRDGGRMIDVVGLVQAAFRQHGIPVLQLAAGGDEGWLLVPRGRSSEAYDIALVMTRTSGAWPPALRSLHREGVPSKGVSDGKEDVCDPRS